MAEEKNGFRLAVYGIILAILFFGLLRVFINTTGNFFRLELLGLLVLLVLAFIGFIGYAKGWGENLLFIVFFLFIVNLLLIWYFYGPIFIVLLILSVVGFLLSLPRPEVPAPKEEPHSVVFDKPKEEPKKEEVVSTSELKKEVKKTHSPGKYVASKNSNVYHEPKCEWAKKIKKDRQVWFKEKKQAWEKGYKKHSCVK